MKELPSFPLNQLKTPFAMSMSAPRRSGKTVQVKNLIHYNINKFDVIIIKSLSQPTLDDYKKTFNENYQKKYKTSFSFSLYQPNDPLIKKLINSPIVTNKKTNRPMQILLVMDDCVTKKIRNDNSILQIYTRGRHNHISLIFTTQQPSLLDTSWRENSDYLVFFNPNTQQSRDFLVKNIFSANNFDNLHPPADQTKKYFEELIKHNSKKYQSIVLDNIDGLAYQLLIYYNSNSNEQDNKNHA